MSRRRLSEMVFLCMLLVLPLASLQAHSSAIVSFNPITETATLTVTDAGPGAADSAEISPKEVSGEILGEDGSVLATLPVRSLPLAGFRRWTLHVEPADAGFQTGILHVDGVAASSPQPIGGGQAAFGIRLSCKLPCPGGVGVSGVVTDRSTGATRASYDLNRVVPFKSGH